MSDIPAFAYDLLGERVVRSVANLTRADAPAFFDLAARAGVKTTVEASSLKDANEALARLREGRITGAAVLVP
jgi:propanol-preferring alcohol dehydrogenase